MIPKRHPGKTVLTTNAWFPISKTIRHYCCRCLARHTFKFRVRKNGDLEMLVYHRT